MKISYKHKIEQLANMHEKLQEEFNEKQQLYYDLGAKRARAECELIRARNKLEACERELYELAQAKESGNAM